MYSTSDSELHIELILSVSVPQAQSILSRIGYIRFADCEARAPLEQLDAHVRLLQVQLLTVARAHELRTRNAYKRYLQ